MSVRPPRLGAGVVAAVVVDALQAEIAQEKAQSLARATQRFETALAGFHAAERDNEAGCGKALTDAADALWALLVQREACGLRDAEAVFRAYAVPPSVRARMGVRVPRSN